MGLRAIQVFAACAVLALSGCVCPDASQVKTLERAGGRYVGDFGACREQWLWFDRPIDDEELARLAPAIGAMSPETLQLTGQIGITDMSIDRVNGFTSLKAVYLDESGISEDGVKRLRRDIRIVHGAGYR
jgi:hypothetical protein